MVQEQLDALNQTISTLKLEKAAEADRASVYQQRMEAAEQKATEKKSYSAPLPSIGEVDAVRSKCAELEKEVVLLRAQAAGAALVATDDQNPGIQTRIIIQEMFPAEKLAVAEREYNALRRAGWEIVHIQFTPDLRQRAVMLEMDTTPGNPIDDAIKEALRQPINETSGDSSPAPAAPVLEVIIMGLNDDEPEQAPEFTFKLEDIQDSNQLRQLWRAKHITVDEYQEHANRIIRQKGARSLATSRAARKPFNNPFRVPVAPTLAGVSS